MAVEQKWYFHPQTKEVTLGPVGSWTDRMGPYDTEQEARQALEKAAARTKQFDDEDEAWD